MTRPKTSILRLIVICAITILLVLSGSFMFYVLDKIDGRRLNEARVVGDKVVRSLEEYRSDHGRYPPQLEELVPKYQSEIPSPPWGLRRWEYTLADPNGNRFWLSVGGNKDRYPALYYTPGNKWIYDN